MKDLYNSIASIVLPQLIPIAFAVFSTLVAFIMRAILARLNATTGNALLEQVDKLATIVVAELEQTVVAPMKVAASDGKLTSEEASRIQAQAVERLKVILGDKNSALRKAFGDVGTVLTSIIEAKVLELRSSPKSAVAIIPEKTTP